MKKTEDKLINEQYLRVHQEGVFDRYKARGKGVAQSVKNVFTSPEDRVSYTDTKASTANQTFINKIDSELSSFNQRLEKVLGGNALQSLQQTSPDLHTLYSNIQDVINNVKQIANQEEDAPEPERELPTPQGRVIPSQPKPTSQGRVVPSQ